MPDRVGVFLISRAPLKDLKLIFVALSEIKYNTFAFTSFCCVLSWQKETDRFDRHIIAQTLTKWSVANQCCTHSAQLYSLLECCSWRHYGFSVIVYEVKDWRSSEDYSLFPGRLRRRTERREGQSLRYFENVMQKNKTNMQLKWRLN